MPIFIYILVILFGLIMGSFLSVVINRLPKMLRYRWETENNELSQHKNRPTYNLALPRSHCPKCQRPILWWQNIPVLSYLLLKGRCNNCQVKIPLFYPLLEIITTILTLWLFVHYGFTSQFIFAAAFTYILIACAGIDAYTKLLPDELTLSGMWLGLIISTQLIFINSEQAIIGAFLGYAVLWLIANAYKWIRKRDGMGYGDLKLLAMLGAFCGAISLLNILFIASILGLVVGVIYICIKRIRHTEPLPFGPYLAIGGWLTLLYGPFILRLLEIHA